MRTSSISNSAGSPSFLFLNVSGKVNSIIYATYMYYTNNSVSPGKTTCMLPHSAMPSLDTKLRYPTVRYHY